MGKDIIQSAQVSRVGKDDKTFPITQVQGYGSPADAVVIWPYGMHGNLPIDSYTINFFVNGQQENRAVIGYRPDIRPKNLKEGEVVFGNFVTGSTVFYDENGNIIVNCENNESVTIKGASTINISGDAALTIGGKSDITVTGDVNVTAPLVKVNGNFEVTGDTTLGANVTSNGKDISDTHSHTGSPTAPAGPVSNTGVPV